MIGILCDGRNVRVNEEGDLLLEGEQMLSGESPRRGRIVTTHNEMNLPVIAVFAWRCMRPDSVDDLYMSSGGETQCFTERSTKGVRFGRRLYLCTRNPCLERVIGFREVCAGRIRRIIDTALYQRFLKSTWTYSAGITRSLTLTMSSCPQYSSSATNMPLRRSQPF